MLKLLECALVSDASRRRYHDSTNIMKSYRSSYLGGESRRRFTWFFMGCEKEPGVSYSYELTLLCEVIRDIDIIMRIVV